MAYTPKQVAMFNLKHHLMQALKQRITELEELGMEREEAYKQAEKEIRPLFEMELKKIEKEYNQPTDQSQSE